MLAFHRLDIIITGIGEPPARNSNVLVCWELVTQHSGVGQVSFTVERSLSPQFVEDETDELEAGIAGIDDQLVYLYDDITADLVNFWRLYYYRIRADTPEGIVYSEVRTWETSPRPHELEMIRRHDFVLRYLQGKPSFAFIERTTDSARCTCFDTTAGRVRRSDCTLCLGTGRQRPYLDPIAFYVDYNPDEKLVQIASFGEIQPREKDCWFSAYPQVKPGDIIYEVMPALLWRVGLVKTIQPMGTTTQHMARLTAVDRDDVEYQRLVSRISSETLQEIVREWEEIKAERMF
jgi:hypothetical protein